MNKSIIIILLLFVICLVNAQQKTSFFNKKETEIFKSLYSYEFKTADSIIVTLSQTESNSKQITFINYYWWQIVSGNDSVYFSRKAISKANEGIKQLKKKNNLSNRDIYSLIIYYAFKARFEILGNNYFKAVKFLQKSIKYISISLDNTDKFENFKLTTGLYLYTVSHLMEKYPLFYPYILFFPKGDKIAGIKYLKECALSKDIVLSTEARYFLMKIYMESEEDFKLAELFAKNLVKTYPGNMVFNYYLYKLLVLQNKIPESERQLQKIEVESKKNTSLNIKQKQHFINIIHNKQ